MHWGVFAISAAHLYLPKLPWRAPPPPPPETSERMNFNVIDKKQLIWKLFIYWYLMSFFHKMFGPPLCHLDQWLLIFYWPKKNILGQPIQALLPSLNSDRKSSIIQQNMRNINLGNTIVVYVNDEAIKQEYFMTVVFLSCHFSMFNS